MKNTFAVTMTLLLALTLGGSYAGYHKATTKEEAGRETAAPSAPSEQASSPDSASTGAAGSAGTTGNVKATNEGGTQGGTNGAVAASGDPSMGKTTANSTEGGATDTNAAGSTGQQPAEMAAAAEQQGDATAGGKTFAGVCAACHGANAQGQIGPSLVKADGPKSWTLAQFTTTLREGKTPTRELGAVMPRFAATTITDSDIANLQAYLKTLN